MKSYKNFVNGQAVDAVEGLTEDIISPVDERVIGRVPKCGEKDVDRAVDAAAAAFETWQDTTPGERSLMLLKLADRIEQNARGARRRSRPRTSASRSASRARKCRSWSTTCASSRAPAAAWRARPRASTSRATRA